MKTNEPMTLSEIAKDLGVSHQAVAELLARALRKIKARLDAKGIKIEDLL